MKVFHDLPPPRKQLFSVLAVFLRRTLSVRWTWLVYCCAKIFLKQIKIRIQGSLNFSTMLTQILQRLGSYRCRLAQWVFNYSLTKFILKLNIILMLYVWFNLHLWSNAGNLNLKRDFFFFLNKPSISPIFFFFPSRWNFFRNLACLVRDSYMLQWGGTEM